MYYCCTTCGSREIELPHFCYIPFDMDSDPSILGPSRVCDMMHLGALFHLLASRACMNG